ncbi:homoserine O-acetyltransferase [Jatrophihabitans endophyticus]|uniref:Homoserine O-acetyltransferase n=1 Tax=Jatrophihabitans endophyticus TaxID=1206085 RepID=A0A1M5DEB1_9ACTN|nr:homoserine O-acetyltransferase [Jatrophihabitans endophyticus]SHF65280.1 homoserine O-acetyltransferase [Jatrophihabitans endophyticus]
MTAGRRDGGPAAPSSGRRFLELGPVDLELGGRLPGVRVAYETYGSPRPDAGGEIGNAVLVLHALTGDAHVLGDTGPDQPTPGWWDGVVGPGRALDTDEWFVVASNVLGGCRGTTGPASPAPDGRAWGSRFPPVTIRDQVAVEAALADRLGVRRYRAVLGGSMGGMRALEWVLGRPERVGAALVLAVGAAATGDQLGTQSTQLAAITGDPGWRGGDYHDTGTAPEHGLGLARRIAHLTYRGERELDVRFGNAVQADGRHTVTSYLEHHAAKLVGRFDAGSYVTLTEAMNGHDVGRGRGGVAAALGGVTVPTVVAGIDTDRLYPLRLQHEIADLLPGPDGVHVVTSDHGHDGFLVEAGQVGDLVRLTLQRAAERSPAPS